MTMNIDISKKKAKSIISHLILSVILSAAFCPWVHADPLPHELIPPDVTLSTGSHASPKTKQKANSKPAPGMAGSKTNQPYTPGNLNLPANGITSGQTVQPPPKGAHIYTGINKTGNANQNQNPNPQQPAPQNQDQSPDPVCVIDTEKGKITIRLFKKFAPKTVEAFTSMVNEGFYNGLNFHRYEPGFVIQGGCPRGNGTGLYIDPKTNQPRMLILESSQYLKHNTAGVVAMAHFPKNPHSSSCQFYITLGAKPILDYKYTIFGGVTDGLDVVFKIRKGDKINSITMVQ